MMTVQAPKVAVISDHPERAALISKVMVDGGYRVLATLPADHRLRVLALSYSPDVWVVSLSDGFDREDVFDFIYTGIPGSLLVDESPSRTLDALEHNFWAARLLGKVQNMVVAERMLATLPAPLAVQSVMPVANSSQRGARHLWVLGASLGGPEAVVAFLREMPAGLPVAFVYAQHIEAAGTKVLVEVVARNTCFEVELLRHGMVLREGQVGVVPVNDVSHILSMGRVVVTAGSWTGPYTPSIDQIMEDVALAYGQYSGAIVFSGMGNDGARGCHRIKSAGGSLWAQSEGSCISSHMPTAVLDTGLVDKVDEPGRLARALIDRYTGLAA